MKNDNRILSISIGKESIVDILQKVNTFLNSSRSDFFHLVNLNPDIFMFAYHDEFFRTIINTADCILIDGIGIKLAAKLTGLVSGERMTGTDLMQLLIKGAVEKNRKVMFLGGNDSTAELTGKFFKKLYPSLEYIFHPGAVKITQETESEKREVLNLIKKFQPDLLFVAYGPPIQEKWIYNNRKELKGTVCMGVGGAFKLISGQVPRAPKIFTRWGIEWIWRSLVEPARIVKKLPRHILFIIFLLQ
ncbi:MAG: glycosyltransferase, partial [Bacteroidetes bacterium]